VREAARKAREVIQGRAAYPTISQQQEDFPLFFALEFYAYQNVDKQFRDCWLPPADHRFLPDDDLARALRVVGTYDANVITYSRRPSGAYVRHDELSRQKPNAAVARLGSRIVALGGLRHLLKNRGDAYEVTRDKAGRWWARPWRVLPGAPLGSSLQPDGRWLIHTTGPSVLLAADGTLSMAGCRPAK
jgi:hypothetical protein